MLGLALAVQLPGAVPFHPMDTYAYTGAATVKASSLNVRSGAGTGYQAIGRLAAGASIQVLGEQRGTDGKTWYQIRFSGTGGTEQTGYVSAEYVRLPVSYTTDSDFESKTGARRAFRKAIKMACASSMPSIRTGCSRPKKQGWTGTR